MAKPDRLDEATTPTPDGGPAPARASVVIDDPIVCFVDGQHATFTRATNLANGALAVELTRTVLSGPPGSTPICVGAAHF